MRNPDFVIGDPSDPYLLRWFLIPRNTRFNVYLHKLLRDDEDRALHDHPWWFFSVDLKGSYKEVTKDDARCDACGNEWYVMEGDEIPSSAYCLNCENPMFVVSGWRKRFSIAFRRAEHRHRVVLKKNPDGSPIPCWTLVVTGPRVREWGFWCPKGFVSWKVFTKPGNKGEVGRGCGD